MKPILNLTQHVGTPEQGVSEPLNKEIVLKLLTFSSIPTKEEIIERAVNLAEIASLEAYDSVMIGGAPYLMSELEKQLKLLNIQPLYSFTERVSIENSFPDGSVSKMSVFKHVGWIEV